MTRAGLDKTRAGLDKQRHEVAAMFDGVARRYDLTNSVLAMGMDRGWRRATRAALALRAGERVLDLGAGTGVSTAELAGAGARAVGLDISLGMLTTGRRARREVCLVGGDALALPFADGTFDAVTISFALRNVQDTPAALREMSRVTRPGGRLVVCEFSRPTWQPFRTVYLWYLVRGLPLLASAVSSHPGAYRYLVESIRDWPAQRELAGVMAGAGWGRVAWRNMAGGAVALHRAVKPAE